MRCWGRSDVKFLLSSSEYVFPRIRPVNMSGSIMIKAGKNKMPVTQRVFMKGSDR